VTLSPASVVILVRAGAELGGCRRHQQQNPPGTTAAWLSHHRRFLHLARSRFRRVKGRVIGPHSLGLLPGNKAEGYSHAQGTK